MSRNVREKQSARRRALLAQTRRRARLARQRRGVLMLVVLSLLVLFLLLGTSFVVITSAYNQGSQVVERSHETSLQADDRLERALLQVLRDTNNPYSSIRYHSLLRDAYGTDGFIGHVYAGALEEQQAFGVTVRSNGATLPSATDPNDLDPNGPGTDGGFQGPPVLELVSRYAGASDLTGDLGPTNGQLIDIFVQDDLGLMNTSGGLSRIEGENGVGLRSEYVVDLELNAQGLTTNHALSRTPGYYNGCLFTMLDGPAKGQTTRVVQYDYFSRSESIAAGNQNYPNIARFRVLAFTRSDGRPLQLGLNPVGAGGTSTPNDLIYAEDTAIPFGTINNLDPFYGRRFMVNGRPHNGSGVGLNPVAGVAGPKLAALERLTLPSATIGMETALAPHARYFVPGTVSTFNRGVATDYLNANYFPARAPFYGNEPQAFTDIRLAGGRYDSFPGLGGSDESYDAADYQNMFLALQSQQPRPVGRVDSLNVAVPAEPSSQQSRTILQNNGELGVRLVLDDVPIPSFHRPALVNYWFHRLYQAPWLEALISDDALRARAILDPTDPDIERQLPATAVAAIISIKRKVMLRPLREDHPNFDGGNPASRYEGRPNPTDAAKLVDFNPNGRDLDGSPSDNPTQPDDDPLDDQIVFPYWEATGPWDVDNDNDGVPDSIWVDLGDPVQKTKGGRLYKPLYAILVQDLDGRLNLNAHGARDHVVATDLDPTAAAVEGRNVENFNLASGASVVLGIGGSALNSSNQLPHGSGWGPGDISLRPVLSPAWSTLAPSVVGDPRMDDYARLLFGRETLDPVESMAESTRGAVPWGRYGSSQRAVVVPGPGINQRNTLAADVPITTDLLASYKLYDVPAYDAQRLEVYGQLRSGGQLVPELVPEAVLQISGAIQPSGYGVAPDLLGRYAAPGLGYVGQPIVESARDPNLPALLADSPYELRLDDAYRRDQPDRSLTDEGLENQNDDAAFSLAEFERLLRPFDHDASRLPVRLWDLVDAFDPEKLAAQEVAADRIRNGDPPIDAHQNPSFSPGPAQFVEAQLEATARRRAVTTDSNELQSAAVNWNARMVFGADGRPGVAAFDDEGVDPDQDSQPGIPDDDTLWDETTVDIDDLDDPTEYNLYDDQRIDFESANPADPVGVPNGLLDTPDEIALAVDAFTVVNQVRDHGVDDYLVIMGAAPKPNARLTDYLRYRVTLELKKVWLRQSRQGVNQPAGIRPAIMPDADRALVATANLGFTAAELDVAERMIDLVINGPSTAATGAVRVFRNEQPFQDGVAKFASYGGLLAPEVMEGQRMDLNRPFGDGRDNDGNGVVDEPAEAGEPWIDTNGDGQWTNNEPYEDLDGDGRFYADFNGNGVAAGDSAVETNVNADDWLDIDGDGVEEPVVDSLFGRQTALQTNVASPVPFDHTNGKDASASGRVIGGFMANAPPAVMPTIRDDGRLARQLYARHLYCLLLLLADENYLAPFDGDDPQVLHYIDPDSITTGGVEVTPSRLLTLPATTTPLPDDMGMAARIKQDLMLADPARWDDLRASAEARRIALRKLTCRKIAQWAVNCADMRDPDAICTPFEYDENPWDGWNVVETARINTSGGTPTLGTLEQAAIYPIDGDARTAENAQVTRSFHDPDTFDPARNWPSPARWNMGISPEVMTDETRPAYFDQTCGLVYGAERPELLVTESLAFHDRAVEDLEIPGDREEDAAANNNNNNNQQNDPNQGVRVADGDADLDQRLRPRGSVFIELYNPWPADGQRPAELYRSRFNASRYADLDKDGTASLEDWNNDGVPDAGRAAAFTNELNTAAPALGQDIPVEGVLLDRLSNAVAPVRDNTGAVIPDPNPDRTGPLLAPSPVWRMICIEEHPRLRNDDPVDNPILKGISAYPTPRTGNNVVPGSDSEIGPDGYIRSPMGSLSVPLTEGFVVQPFEPQDTDAEDFSPNRRTDLPPDWYQGGAEFRWRQLNGAPRALKLPDPDFPTFDPYTSPRVYFAASNGGLGRAVYQKPECYVEREWYFTRGVNDYSENPNRPATVPVDRNFNDTVEPSDVRLCIPMRPITVPLVSLEGPVADDLRSPQLGRGSLARQMRPDMVELFPSAAEFSDLRIFPWRFPPVVREEHGGEEVARAVRPAPILPGRYAVIGSAGTEYRGAAVNTTFEGRYITKIGRIPPDGDDRTHPFTDSESNLRAAEIPARVTEYRRIELVPNRNPFLHQVVFARNGGDECRVLEPFDPTPGDGDPSDGYYLFNATDPSSFPTDPNDPGTTRVAADMKQFNEQPTSDNGVKLPPFYTNMNDVQAFHLDPTDPRELRYYAIKPAVALPIEGMNISEPLDSYWLRKWDLETRATNGQSFIHDWNPDAEAGEGAYVRDEQNHGYDRPFDLATELCVNHTTPNYRTVHLQRLANPLLAWNPPPVRPNGAAHPQHDPGRPVNPYRTVDSLSLDLTAFNGINNDETADFQEAPGQHRTDFLRDLLASGAAARNPLDPPVVGNGENDPDDPATLHQRRHFLPPRFPNTTGEADSTLVLMTMASTFKGFHEEILEFGDEPENLGDPITVTQTLRPGRRIWGQERPNQMIDILNSRIDLFDTQPQVAVPPSPGQPGNLDVIRVRVHENLDSRQTNTATENLAVNFPISHSLGYDNFATVRAVVSKPNNVSGAEKAFYPAGVELRNVFSSSYENSATFGIDPSEDTSRSPYLVDLDGDGVLGDLVSTPKIDVRTGPDGQFARDNPRTPLTTDDDDPNNDLPPAEDPNFEQGKPDYRNDVTNPWLGWQNRPYASAMEVLLTPSSSQSRLLADFSFINPFVADPPNRYDGVAAIQNDNSQLVGGTSDFGAEETNNARIGSTRFPYGHLLNFFQSAAESAVTIQIGDQPIPIGAPNFHRLFDYVQTPSRFVGTEVMLNPQVANSNLRLSNFEREPVLPAPFNRVSQGREPGKVNLNTVVGRQATAVTNPWSDVYDGLMHRVRDSTLVLGGNLVSTGHFGPAWRDVVLSRRGYSIKAGSEADISQFQRYSMFDMHRDYPTRFANPFRAATGGDLVPLLQLEHLGADASMLRAHPFSPGSDGLWGSQADDAVIENGNPDDNVFLSIGPDLLIGNALEAGSGDDNLLFSERTGSFTTTPAALRDKLGVSEGLDGLIQPLFSEGSTEPALDAGRNAGVAYSPLTRLSNLTTTRSGNFAVWITVGFFEVTAAPDWNDPDTAERDRVRARFGNDRNLYDRVYPDGYQLGRELGSDSGDVQRFRGFWLIDRTLPVAFKPGENINAERAIRLRRRIE